MSRCAYCHRDWCDCGYAAECAEADERERAEEQKRIYAEAAALGLDPLTWKPYEPGLLDENEARERLEMVEQARHDMARYGEDY